LGLVTDPALDHLVLVELDTDHSFVALGVEGFVRATLESVILLCLDLRLETVAHVGGVLSLMTIGQFNNNGLVVNDGPVTNFAIGVTLGGVKHLHGVVSREEQVQFAGLAWHAEFNV